MTEKEFIPSASQPNGVGGKVSWQAPSNIALVKYWGKKKEQIPANPSVSFTLNNCLTKTTVWYEKRDEKTSDYSLEVFFEAKPKPEFEPKIRTFFTRVEKYLPFLKEYHFKIDTANTFPHSSGIASSASGMAALALCLVEIEEQLGVKMEESFFKKKASFLARLGSGSASRSIDGGLVVWGQNQVVKESTDLYGTPYPYEVHEVFRDFQDTILLVHKGEKAVSSTLGHQLMLGHWYAQDRFRQAHSNLERLRSVFKEGDLKSFIEIVESEALTLHAMMMTSVPYFILMKPNTLHILERIWAFRSTSGLDLCFTLDAGANVHLLYPAHQKKDVLQFIEDELVAYCEKGHYICDQIGEGAKKF